MIKLLRLYGSKDLHPVEVESEDDCAQCGFVHRYVAMKTGSVSFVCAGSEDDQIRRVESIGNPLGLVAMVCSAVTPAQVESELSGVQNRTRMTHRFPMLVGWRRLRGGMTHEVGWIPQTPFLVSHILVWKPEPGSELLSLRVGQDEQLMQAAPLVAFETELAYERLAALGRLVEFESISGEAPALFVLKAGESARDELRKAAGNMPLELPAVLPDQSLYLKVRGPAQAIALYGLAPDDGVH